jgi:predicted AAA+ superfamily ATPase
MLTAAFIFFKVSRFDIKGKKLLEIHEKYYAGDIGLKHVLLGYKTGDIAGHLENIVYLELLSRGYKVEIGKLNGQEIDFIAHKGTNRIYIQVAYLLNDQKTIEREFSVLEKISDNYPKLVLSMDKYFDRDTNGIQWRNLIEYLCVN